MASKYELTISTGYVPDWTYVEAVRELFQNALDNQVTNPENKMFITYTGDTLCIGNKTSVLELDTLLLGSSSKRDDVNTIGKHGEGYKVGIMVLLREGKTVTVYNYGKREVWETKLVKSKRFNNSLIPVIIVNKKAVWKKVPDSNLVIEVKGITPEEYSAITAKNLHLQTDIKGLETSNGMGTILLDSCHKGKLFVNGLYICTDTTLHYGYNIAPKFIKLDRDRRLVSTIDIIWETARMWRNVNRHDLVKSMLLIDAPDVKYIQKRSQSSIEDIDFDTTIGNTLVEDFQTEYGMNAIPVVNNEDLERVRRDLPDNKPIIVNTAHYSYLASRVEALKYIKQTPKQRLSEWVKKLEHKLSDEELDDFRAILDDLK